MALLIDDALILTMDAQRRILDPGHLVIEGRRIKTAGAGRFAGDPRGLDVYDAARRIVMPGLVNAHTHSYGNLVKGTLENLPLEIWMLHVIAQGRRMEPEDVVLNAALGCIEMLKGGVTTCLDQLAEDRENLGQVAAEYRRLGFRTVLDSSPRDWHVRFSFRTTSGTSIASPATEAPATATSSRRSCLTRPGADPPVCLSRRSGVRRHRLWTMQDRETNRRLFRQAWRMFRRRFSPPRRGAHGPDALRRS